MIKVQIFSMIISAGILFSFITMTFNFSSAIHTTKGANFWYGVCTNPIVDSKIVEDCRGLVSNHDTYGHGLTTEGWRVAKCVAGGALLIAGGYPELLTAGPAVGCGSTSLPNTNSPSTGNDLLGGLLGGLIGK